MELTMVNVIVTDIDGLNYLKKLWVCFWSFWFKKNVYDKVIIFLYDDNFIPVYCWLGALRNALRNLKILYSTANIIW